METYTYGPIGEITSVTDPTGRRTTMTYDSLARLVEIVEEDSGGGQAAVRTFEYGDSSRPVDVTATVDPTGRRWTFVNVNGGVPTALLPSGTTTHYQYDIAGRRTAMVTPGPSGPATTTFEMNGFGDVVAVTDPAGAVIGHSSMRTGI